MIPIPGIDFNLAGANYCNSDESILAAVNARGRDFRRSHSQRNITASVINTHLASYKSKIYWNYFSSYSAGNQNRIYKEDRIYLTGNKK